MSPRARVDDALDVEPISGPWALVARQRLRVAIGVVSLLATSALTVTVPYLLRLTVEALRERSAAPLVALMVGAGIAVGAGRIVSRLSLLGAARYAEERLRTWLFSQLLTLDGQRLRELKAGELMSRLSSDVYTVQNMWGLGLLTALNTACTLALSVVLMAIVDPWLTLWSLLPYPLMFLVGTTFGRRIQRAGHAVQEQTGNVASLIEEDFANISLIKTHHLERGRVALLDASSRELVERGMRVTAIRGKMEPSLLAIGSLGTVIALYMGGAACARGSLSLGQLVQFTAYLALLVWPTMSLGWAIALFRRGRASWARLAPLLESRSSGVVGALPPARTSRARSGPPHVEVRGLDVERDGRAILEDVHLTLRAGTMTAIVGRTGAGKSVLVEVLAGLSPVPRGVMFVDGTDVTQIAVAEYRSSIGYAAQDAYLFSIPILDNVRYGLRSRPAGGEAAEQAEVWSAVEAAELAREVLAMPDGLATVVGERGMTLSGGQRQRVALARALVSSSPLVILDDALSSVDAETERRILTSLSRRLAGRTSVIVSHRLGAIRQADQIAVLERGRLVECGTHDELLRRGGVYADLYRTQTEAIA